MNASLMLLLQRAQERIAELGVPYRGDVYPAEAQRLVDEAGATIVDVRSKAEWDWVGRVPGSTLVEWELFPGARRNDEFIAQLARRGDCRLGSRVQARLQHPRRLRRAARSRAPSRHARRMAQGRAQVDTDMTEATVTCRRIRQRCCRPCNIASIRRSMSDCRINN